jgi:SAM-dependent methyltransferase
MAHDISTPLGLIAAGFRQNFTEFGATPRGVLWGDGVDGQALRFDMLLQILKNDISSSSLSLNDLGCGYGALFEHVKDMPFMENGFYYGYDICQDMIDDAKTRFPDSRATFTENDCASKSADYSFVCGTFNMCATQSIENWTAYIHNSLINLFQKSIKGLAFNLLDEDQNVPQDWLYYACAQDYVAFCRQNLSSHVEILRDPRLNEFTILVHKSA